MLHLLKRPAGVVAPALLRALLVGVLGSCAGLSGESAHRVARLAEDLVERGDTTAAVDLLESVDLDATGEPEIAVRLGELYRARATIVDRLHSQRVLERARQLHPHDADVLAALARTYYAQSFYPDAERCLREVLRMEPGHCEARAWLGALYFAKWRRVNAYTDDLAVASRYLASALECDEAGARTATDYLYSLYVLEETDSLAIECRRIAERFPERGEPHLMLGVLAFEEERFEEAREHFDRGLDLLHENERAVFEQTDRVLSYGEQDRFDAMQANQRPIMERRWWLDVDPDVTTDLNESRLEHIYRVFLADVCFRVAHSPRRGWDTERGELLVKFGWPSQIQSTLDTTWKDGREERWLYETDGGFFQFRFVDERLNGDLRIPLADDTKLSWLRRSVQRYSYTPLAIPVPGEIDVVTFKDDDFSTSVCMAVRIDADSLDSAVDPAGFNRFRFRSAVFGGEWEAERRTVESMWTADVPVVFRNGRREYDLVRTLQLPFDDYHLACTFEDEGRHGAAHMRADGSALRYAGDGMALSDILLEAQPGTGATPIVRGDQRLVPNPGHAYRHGQRVSAYFEIYNLTASGGRATYDVTFAIFDSPEVPPPTWRRWGAAVARWMRVAPEVEPAISQTFERTAEGHRASERMRIDVESLAEGRYQLVVTVRDRGSGEAATTGVTFVKEGQEQARR